MARVFYCHGWAGSSQSDKVAALRASGLEVDAVDIDYRALDLKALSNLAKHADVIVGSSLGGWVAAKLSQMTKVSAVLINPSCNPRQSLVKYNQLTPEQLEQFSPIVTDFETPTVVLLATDDEVIDPAIAQGLFTGKCGVYTVENAGHRFTDHATIVHHVNSLVDSFISHDNC